MRCAAAPDPKGSRRRRISGFIAWGAGRGESRVSWNLEAFRAAPGKGGSVKRGHAAATFAAFIWICAGVCAVGTADAVPPGDSTKSSPWLSEALRHSEKGSRDLLGLPVDPSLPEREITRLADRLREKMAVALE